LVCFEKAAAEFELQFGVAATIETPSGASSIGVMLMTGLLARYLPSLP
jgi:hypothetical protein